MMQEIQRRASSGGDSLHRHSIDQTLNKRCSVLTGPRAYDRIAQIGAASYFTSSPNINDEDMKTHDIVSAKMVTTPKKNKQSPN